MRLLSRLLILSLTLMFSFLVPLPALAYRVNLLAYAEGGKIHNFRE